jgi:endonuclease/exonuclease/phosphatase family metal-dependent hydrolase
MPASIEGTSNLRVLTFNLWALRGDWVARRRVVVAGLKELRPDIVAFIEAIRTDQYDQARDVLGDSYYFAYQERREPDGQGATIASRWPISGVHEVDLAITPRTAGFAAITLVAEIDVPGPIGRVYFANHVPNWQTNFELERERQALAAARFLESVASDADTHVILAGDFTADPDSAGVRFIAGRQSLDGMSVCYRDAWVSVHGAEAGETFVPSNPLVADWDWPFRRLDYVFVRCGEHGGPTLEVDRCDVVFDQSVDGVWASDHFGVLAELVLPRRRSQAVGS